MKNIPEEPIKSIVQKAIHYLFPAMVGSSISTIVIFIPFELMSGVAGAYFKVMTNTMIITLGMFIFCNMDLSAVLSIYFSQRSPKEIIANRKTEKPMK